MWNHNKEMRQQIEVALTAGAVALTSTDRLALRNAAEALRRAWTDAPFGWTEELNALRLLLDRVEARLRDLSDAAMTSCPCCGGRELLVAERCSVEGFGAISRIRFTAIVCRACGDTRMRCDDPADLLDNKEFRTVTLPPPVGGGAYR